MGFNHLCAQGTRTLRRAVRAIIGNDIKIIKFTGIIHPLKVFDNIANNLFLVMRRHQHQEAALGRMIGIILRPSPKAQNCQHHLIYKHEHQPAAQQR